MKNICSRIVISLTIFALAACATHQQSPQTYKPAVEQPTMSVKQMIAKSKTQSSDHAASKKVVGAPVKIDEKATKVETGSQAVETATKDATTQVRSTSFVNGIMYYPYEAGKIYTIITAPLHITDIELEKGEKTTSISAGDTTRWKVSTTTSGAESTDPTDGIEHILVKPLNSNITNTVIVTTDKRTYYLLLKSTDNAYTPIVRWHYGDNMFVQKPTAISGQNNDANDPCASVDPLHFDDNYHADVVESTGPRGQMPSWTPSLVYNNGDKTFIQFPTKLENAPALFVGQTPHMVNYRVVNNCYIIDSVVHDLQLRMGQNKHQTIVQISYQGNKRR
ncbi:MAG: TrbG/VirB9 family P-type conjugative transfer protein [Pseudomonadota bacterium]